jgi:hypothetical protein
MRIAQNFSRKICKENEAQDNIKIDLKEIGCEGKDWIKAAQDRIKGRALVNIKGGEFLDRLNN